MTEQVDEATKAKLRAEAARLVSMGMAADKARRIVWDDYLEELAAYAAAQPVDPQPEPSRSRKYRPQRHQPLIRFCPARSHRQEPAGFGMQSRNPG
jgi:hypothetical protein